MTPDDVVDKLVERVADLQRQINELNRIEQPSGAMLFRVLGRQGGNASFWTSPGASNFDLVKDNDVYFGSNQATVNAGTKVGNVTITLPTSYTNSAFLALACLRGSGNVDAEINVRELTANSFGVYVTLQVNAAVNTNYGFNWWCIGPPA